MLKNSSEKDDLEFSHWIVFEENLDKQSRKIEKLRSHRFLSEIIFVKNCDYLVNWVFNRSVISLKFGPSLQFFSQHFFLNSQ